MRSLRDMTVQVVPGSGVVARKGEAVATFGERTEPKKAAAIMRLIEETRGKELIRLLARHVSETDPSELPSFGVVADDEEGLVYFVHGDMAIRLLTDEGQQVHSGRESLTFIDGFVGGAHEIEVSPPNATLESSRWPGALIDGVVPGGGLRLLPAPPELADIATDGDDAVEESSSIDDGDGEVVEVIEEPDVVEFESIDLTDLDHVTTAPLPVVERPEPDEVPESVPAHLELVAGVRCARGHFNHPDARFCAHCGIAMVHQTHVLVHDARPPLGIVVFNDGATFVVDTDYVIGRDPELDPRVQSGKARPIELENDGVISRSHLLLQLEGWNVYVVDRSSNGTELLGSGQWRRLDKNVATVLEPGAELRFGRYQFSFDSHHRQGG